MEWLAAARLVRRTGFGATGAGVDAAAKQGAAAYVDTILTADPGTDPGARTTPPPTFDRVARPGKDADQATRKAHGKAVRAQLQDLTIWWLRRMALVQQPLEERLTFYWHHHFATSAAKVRDASWMLGQNQTLRANARGDFHTLALAMLTDPAMLRWLDGSKNVAGSPNENLSREYMELFTLGHGNGYTENDVREGARALTGWSISKDGTAKLRPARRDSGSKTVLGVTGDLDEKSFCEAILARPPAAQYVASRLYGQLASADPDAARLAQLGDVLRPAWDITALLRNILLAPDFTAAQHSLVVSPVEWLVGAVRALDVPVDDDTAVRKLARVLRQLGQLPFYPPSVGGWPPGPAWLSTAAAEIRMGAAAQLSRVGDLSAIRAAGRSDRIDAVGHLLGVGNFSPRSAQVLTAHLDDPPKLVAVALNTSEYLTS